MINTTKLRLFAFIMGMVITGSSLMAEDKVYAVVNGKNITAKDIAAAIKNPRIKFESLKAEQKKQILDGIIEQKLLTNKAYKTNIVKSAEYKKELEKAKKTLAFQIWLRDFGKKIKASDSEVKKYYDENIYRLKKPLKLKASHILVKTEKEAKSVIAKLSKSKNLKVDFTKLAKEKSIGPSASNGGELGRWFTKDQMVAEFSNAAATLKIGKMTKKPVKIQYGYHVIYLDDRQDPATLPYAQIKNRLKQELLQKKFTQTVKKEADALRKKAKIQYK